ncbi:AT-rich interactive domain-containing protein 1-like isoform X2 [Bidens hawaiensis]|uniref:AT-rich interactive domain-containing protein 1-like isoform X2 n=1 Tax=Bidens hawaiensis TaxID=980011 RepID=UPI00404A315A
MGTKRAFEEDLQGFIKNPKHLDYATKPASVTETKLSLETVQVVGIPGENDISVPDVVIKELEINEPLPLVTGIDNSEDDSGPGPLIPPNLFSELFEYNFSRRQLFQYEDIYSSVFNRSPRKEIPIGSNHQADVPEFDPEMAKEYHQHDEMEHLLGVCIIPTYNSMFDSSSDIQADCKCSDHGSVRCVQQHVEEARLKLKERYGEEKFVAFGMLDMGEEVASRWSEDEERLYHAVVYSNPVSVGRMFWKQLSVAFPSRTKKELVSYYFNVFILRRRAVQNRSRFLDIDSDDDEWCGSYAGSFGNEVEDDDFVVGDRDSFSEDGGIDGNNDVGVESSKNEDEDVVTEGEQENAQLISKDGIVGQMSRCFENEKDVV